METSETGLGDDVSAGMAKSPDVFPAPVVDTIRRGEVACDLPGSLRTVIRAIRDAQYYEAVGCDQCGLGYRGRSAVYEVLFMTDRLKDAICAHADAARLDKIAREDGMKTMLQDGVEKAAAGITSIQEVARVMTAYEG